MEKKDRILVTGAKGLIGSAVVSELSARGFKNLIAPSHREVDLTNQGWTESLFSQSRIDYVLHCAARVGGILANSKEQYEFLYENLMIAANVIHAARLRGVKKILFLGSSCVYPRHAGAADPIKENQLLSGPLEQTNEGYAIAKIAGIKLCEFYRKQYGRSAITAMLTNSYGPNDNFNLMRAHIIPALMRRFHAAKTTESKSVDVWGTGTPVREFLHSQDVAKALVLLMEKYDGEETINVGCGSGVSVSELAETMREVVGLKAEIVHDLSKPDGTPRKILDVRKITELGWKPEIPLSVGLRSTYEWAIQNKAI